MKRQRWAGTPVRTARAHWKTRLPLPCYRCGKPVLPEHRWHVEHVVDRAMGGDHGVSNQWVSHGSCNERAGGKLGASRTNARREPVVTRRLEDRRLEW